MLESLAKVSKFSTPYASPFVGLRFQVGLHYEELTRGPCEEADWHEVTYIWLFGPNVPPVEAAPYVVVHETENFLNGLHPPIFHFPASISLSQALNPHHPVISAERRLVIRAAAAADCPCARHPNLFNCNTNVGTVQISQHCEAAGGEKRYELLDLF